MAKEVKYLYLDDNEKTMRDGDVDFINKKSERIEIIPDYPSSWHHRSTQILAELNSIDGLILDWELTNNSAKAKEGASNAEDIDYSAESLAEHIRISISQQARKDIPIIICSADKNKAFTTFQLRDQSSRDLFDLAYVKNDLFVHKVDIIEPQLFDLAIVYKKLFESENRNIETILNLENLKLEGIDIRFIDRLQTMLKNRTTHDVVQFLLREFIEKEGLLISEDVLAARLGVDKIASKEDWGKILDIVSSNNVIYKGYLSVGWKNFWAFELELWWANCFHDSELRVLGAKERVKMLNEKFGLELLPAEKIKFCSSDEYWTICYGLKRPIDPIDAYRIGEDISYPWQDVQYVSALAELEKPANANWRINILDREQYIRFKTLITKEKMD